MRISTTIFLAFLVTSLGTYYLLEAPPWKRTNETEPIRILTLGEGYSLSFLKIEKPKLKEAISLRRKGSNWMMESPVSYPAENFLVEGMINALAFSRRARRLPFQKAQAKEFGFDSPEIKVSLQTKKESPPLTLLLGEESPVVRGVYARWEGENEYFLIPLEVKAAFERTAYSLRQKKLFRLHRDELIEMSVKMEEKEFRVEKRGGKWRWALPAVLQEIPLEKISELVYAFQLLYVKEFLDGEKVGKNKFGLQSASNFLILKEKGGREEKLVFGALESRKGAFYAVRKKENIVLLVSEKNLHSLVQTFETIFLESQSGDQRETSSGSGEDRAGRPASQKKPG